MDAHTCVSPTTSKTASGDTTSVVLNTTNPSNKNVEVSTTMTPTITAVPIMSSESRDSTASQESKGHRRGSFSQRMMQKISSPSYSLDSLQSALGVSTQVSVLFLKKKILIHPFFFFGGCVWLCACAALGKTK